MVERWRLTRNRYGRAVYDALARVGLTATVMTEYVRSLEGDVPDGTVDGALTVERCSPDRVAPLDAPTEALAQGEEVVAAFDGHDPLGYLFLSTDTVHTIDPLERDLAFDGAYVRRVYVAPDHRNRGVATAMLAVTCRRAAESGAERATALVALDNKPSRALFERHGFEPRRTRRYVRVGPVSHRSVAEARPPST